MKENAKKEKEIILKSYKVNDNISIKIIYSPFDHITGDHESHVGFDRDTKIVICVRKESLITIPSNLFPSLEAITQEKKVQIDRSENNYKKRLIDSIFRRLQLDLINWSDNDYRTQIIDHKIAFPLLKKLREVGETKFQIIFQQEILKAYATNTSQVKDFLKREGYLNLIGDFF